MQTDFFYAANFLDRQGGEVARKEAEAPCQVVAKFLRLFLLSILHSFKSKITFNLRYLKKKTLLWFKLYCVQHSNLRLLTALMFMT